MIIEEIIFNVLALYLFIMMFFKMMKKNESIYIGSLIMQAIGMAINFIGIIFFIELNIYLKILTYILSILIPIIILLIERQGRNVAEELKIFIAKIAFKTNNIKYAKKVLLEVIEKYPDSYKAHRDLAAVYEKEGGMRKAIDEYVIAVDLNKKDYDSYYRISFLLKDLDKKDDAKVMLENLLSKKPDYINAIILLGDIYIELEQYKEALNTYSSGLRYSPNDYNLLYCMGMSYTLLNDFQNAKICYEKAATINNLLFKAYYDIAQINLISNELDDAEKYFTKALDDEELEADAYYHLGKVYMMRGDHSNAVKFVNLAIELDNNYIKEATKEPLFIPVASKFSFPIIDDEDYIEKKRNLTFQEEKVREHLEKTYKVVDMLNLAKMRNPKIKDIDERELE